MTEFFAKRSISLSDGHTTKSMHSSIEKCITSMKKELGELVISELLKNGGSGIVRLTQWDYNRKDLPIKEVGILANVSIEEA